MKRISLGRGPQGKARRAVRRKGRVDERGVALILVLGAITVLTVFLTQLQEETSSELPASSLKTVPMSGRAMG